MKKKLSILMEWIRPIGIAIVFCLSEQYGTDAISKFHYVGLITVIIMSGTTASDSFILIPVMVNVLFQG